MEDIPVLKDYRLAEYFLKLSADSLYPSAGSSAAMTVAHAAALFAMACRVNLRKIKKDPIGRGKNNDPRAFWQEILRQANLFLEQALALAQEDGFAVKDFVEGVPGAAERATGIPLQIARCAHETIALLMHAIPKSYAPVQADMECARCLAEGGIKAALAVARSNLSLLSQDKRGNYVNLIAEIESKG